MDPPIPDRSLLEAAIEAHADSMYRVAFRLLGDREGADEIVQETFIGAWKGIGGLKDPKKIKSWLFGILRHQVYQAIKRSNRRPKLEAFLQEPAAPDRNLTELQQQVQLDQPLGLDIKRLSHNNKDYLQIGLATPRDADFDKAPPLNLVLVVDCSGSMSVGNRMDRVRRGLSLLMERMRPKDLVSIVSFSDTADVRLAACEKANGARIRAGIESLQPGSSTNLHAGLMLGYQTAMEHFDSARSNRVILLTDGIANMGTTDPAQISKESKSFNKKGVDLSTIGVGQDFNHQLLRELASAGKGAVHFVNDQSDLTKCFLDEFDSLLSPSARNLELSIHGIRPKNVPTVFGYKPTITDDVLKVKLENMSSGATQVVILEFDQTINSPLEIKVKFSDALTGEKRVLAKSLHESTTNIGEGDFRKNLAIAIVAQGLLDIAKKDAEGKSFKPVHQKTLKKALRNAKQLFPQHEEDTDFSRIAKIAHQLTESKNFAN